MEAEMLSLIVVVLMVAMALGVTDVAGEPLSTVERSTMFVFNKSSGLGYFRQRFGDKVVADGGYLVYLRYPMTLGGGSGGPEAACHGEVGVIDYARMVNRGAIEDVNNTAMILEYPEERIYLRDPSLDICNSGWGEKISISNKRILVAARRAGFVALYEKSKSGWQRTHVFYDYSWQHVTDVDVASDGTIAISVAREGQENEIIIYNLIENEWQETYRIFSTDRARGFGSGLAIDNGILVVKASIVGGEPGSIFVYERIQRRDLNLWMLIAKRSASNRQTADLFGFSLAISKDTIVVGSRDWGLETGVKKAGAFYIFERNHGGMNNWGEVAHFHAHNEGDVLGYSSSVQGDLAIFGSWSADDVGKNYGAAILCRRLNGTNWVLDQKFVPNTDKLLMGENNTYVPGGFGISVAIDGDSVFVGSYDDAFNNQEKVGTIQEFQVRLQGNANTTEGNMLLVPSPPSTQSPTTFEPPARDFQSCTTLNREEPWSNTGGSPCGPCKRFYHGKNGSSAFGQCHYYRGNDFFVRWDGIGEDGEMLIDSEVAKQIVRTRDYDFDHDGDVDLIITTESISAILENIGTKTTPHFAKELDFETLKAQSDLGRLLPQVDNEFVDFDNDGEDELVFGLFQDKELYIMDKNENGMYEMVPETSTTLFGMRPMLTQDNPSIMCEDLIGRGFKDCFISVDNMRLMMRFLWNSGNGTLQERNELNPLGHVPRMAQYPHLAFFDIDGDGDKDAVFTYDTGLMNIWRNDWPEKTEHGYPVFTELRNEKLDPFRLIKTQLAPKFSSNSFANLFGSTQDTVMINTGYSTTRFMQGSSDSTQTTFFRFHGGLGTNQYSLLSDELNPQSSIDARGFAHVHAVDLNGNGQPELIVGIPEVGFQVYENVDGQFLPAQGEWMGNLFATLNADMGQATRPNIYCQDLDDDGDADCFVGTVDGSIIYLRNDGNATDPTFVILRDVDGNPLRDHLVGLNPSVVMADFDGDAVTDVVVADDSGNMFFYHNQGTLNEPRFTEGIEFGQGFVNFTSPSLETMDINGDGTMDVFIGTRRGQIIYLRNDGVGDGELLPNFSVGGYEEGGCGHENKFFGIEQRGFISIALTFVDYDQDGDLDCLFGSSDGVVRTLLNTARECASECLGRGICGTDLLPDQSVTMSAISWSNGFADYSSSAGVCACDPSFAGNQCEKCAEQFYGPDCNHKCPENSRVNVSIAAPYPVGPRSDDCVCDPTFSKVQQEDGDLFQCLCAPGYGFNSFLHICEVCPLGQFKEAYGNDPCQVCPGAHQTTENTGSTDISNCVCQETFVKIDGECVCDKDRYGKPEVDAFCEKCPLSTPFTLDYGSRSISSCLTGPGSFTMVSATGNGNNVPISCSEPELYGKCVCEEKGLSLETLPLKPGYWRISTQSLDIRVCPQESFCRPRALGSTSNNNNNNNNNNNASSDSDQYCSPHHTGILCGSCVDGYQMANNNTCIRCSDEQDSVTIGFWILFIFIVLLWIFTPSVWLVLSFVSTRRKKQTKRKRFRTNMAINFPYTLSRIMLGFYQVYFIFVITAGLLPSSGSWFRDVVNGICNFNVKLFVELLIPRCVYDPNYLESLVFYTLAPIVVLVVLVFTMQVLRSRRPDEKVPIAARTMWIVFQLCLFVYPGISAALLYVFLYDSFERYPEDSEPVEVLLHDMEVPYDSDLAKSLRIYASIMILFYPVGIAAFFAWTTHQHVKIGQDKTKIKESPLLTGSAFIVEQYEPSYAYFECIELLRKLILTSLYLLFHQAFPETSVLLFAILVIFFLVMLIKTKPYRLPVNQVCAEFSLLCLLIVAILGIFQRLFKSDSVQSESLYVATIIVGVLQFVIGLAIYTIHVCRQSKDTQTKTNDNSSEEDNGSNNTNDDEDDGETHPSSFTSFTAPTIQQEQTQPIKTDSGKSSMIVLDNI